MTAPKLLIRKVMMNVQGRMRPCIQVQAAIDARLQGILNEHFLNENLFKRSSYASGFPQGAPIPPPSLAPHLANFMKNDACPEITVKTIVAGQMHQSQTIWEMKSFEYIAQRAFDALLELMKTAAELGTETVYRSPVCDLAAFDADTAAEMAAELSTHPIPADVADIVKSAA